MDDLEHYMTACGRLRDENRDKAERIKELEAALKKYGRHTGSCETRFIDTDIDPTGNTFGNCDCGFEQALKGGK